MYSQNSTQMFVQNIFTIKVQKPHVHQFVDSQNLDYLWNILLKRDLLICVFMWLKPSCFMLTEISHSQNTISVVPFIWNAQKRVWLLRLRTNDWTVCGQRLTSGGGNWCFWPCKGHLTEFQCWLHIYESLNCILKVLHFMLCKFSLKFIRKCTICGPGVLRSPEDLGKLFLFS